MRQSFNFQKIAGTLNRNIFLKNLQNPSLYIKEQSSRRKFKIKSWLIFFKNSQKWSKQFWSVQGKTHLLGGFSSVFCVLTSERTNFVSGAHFRVTFQIFRGPTTSENATFRHEILELGSYKNLAQHRMCSFLFFKITPPHCTVYIQWLYTQKRA